MTVRSGIASAFVLVMNLPLSGGMPREECGYFECDPCGCGGYHVASQTGLMVNWPHGSCQYYEGPPPGGGSDDPFDRHFLCQVSHHDDSGLASVYAAVVNAAGRSDVAAVLRLAPAARDYVGFNASRGSIQVRACSGYYIVANIPVRGEELLVAARRLPASTALVGAGGL